MMALRPGPDLVGSTCADCGAIFLQPPSDMIAFLPKCPRCRSALVRITPLFATIKLPAERTTRRRGDCLKG